MTYRLELAEHFNSRVPVGTPVRYWSVRGKPLDYWDTVTRSEAWRLGDGTPVVLLEGLIGGVHIEDVRVLPAQVSERLREATRRVPFDEIADRLRGGDARTAWLRTTLYELREAAEETKG